MTESDVIFEVVSSKENSRWNEIVRSYLHWDIYYLNEYARSFEIHGDGEAFLISFQWTGSGQDDIDKAEQAENVMNSQDLLKQASCRLCYVVMKKDIGTDEKFADLLPADCWYDLETPYGYGGFLLQGTFTKEACRAFVTKMSAYAEENRIVSQFVRFYPVYHNETYYERMQDSAIRYLRDTIYIDTTDKENIMANMDSKNRNMVRKAIKSGVTICHDKGEHLDDFIRIYESTMDYDHATSYYYFKREYYEYLIEHMKEQLEIFYSVYEGKYIGAAIFFYNKEYMHYHLSGMYTEYRSTAATNLLLYEAAVWACERGIRLLHLGGGLGAEDSLFGFKKQFNKKGRLPFYVGRTIFDKEVYKELMRRRKEADASFDLENSFMIQYRK